MLVSCCGRYRHRPAGGPSVATVSVDDPVVSILIGTLLLAPAGAAAISLAADEGPERVGEPEPTPAT